MQETPQPENNGWNPPQSLEGVPLPQWPENVFPKPFDEFAKEVSRSTETPIELSAMLILAVVATASQKKYQVKIKEDYSEPVNIWTIVILPPASRKSSVYSEVTNPLKEWEFEQKELIEPQIKSVSSKRKTIEERVKVLRNQAAKALEDDLQSFHQEIEQLESELEEVPSYPRIWASDVTPEQLGTLMGLNEEAMAILSDEGGIFDILGGLYSDGKANIDLFLQAHSASSVRVDRGSRAPICMQRPVLTMGLTIQPQVINSLCNNKTFRGRGLLGRFLFVFPKSNIGERTFNEPPMNLSSRNAFKLSLRKILDHPFAGEGKKKTQHILSLSAEAYVKWREYAKTLEVMMSEEVGHLSRITDWGGKLAGAIARIAGLIHIMRHASQAPWGHQISLEDMSSAVKIGHFLINHALKAFELIQEAESVQMARDICRWLKQEKLHTFTLREANRKFRPFRKDNRTPALEILIDHEIIRERGTPQELKPGRPSSIYEVNPFLHKE